jgi:hypothetical protein
MICPNSSEPSNAKPSLENRAVAELTDCASNLDSDSSAARVAASRSPLDRQPVPGAAHELEGRQTPGEVHAVERVRLPLAQQELVGSTTDRSSWTPISRNQGATAVVVATDVSDPC